MMKLLVVTRETSEDRRYGLGGTLAPILDALAQKGHEIRYWSQTECLGTHIKWTPRFQRLLRGLGPLGNVLAERFTQGISAARQAVRMQATHIWVHDPWLAWGVRLGLITKPLGHWHGVKPKLIISEHGLGSFAWSATQDGLELTQRQYRWLLYFEAKSLAHADRVIIPSDTACLALQRDVRCQSRPHHWEVLGYGAPMLQLTERQVACDALGLDPTQPIVLAMGRLAPVKHFDLLVDAIAQVERDYQLTPQLVIAGDGDRQLLTQAPGWDRLTITPKVGVIQPVDQALSVADIYVSACAVESFGQANREAIAAGLACVVAAGGASNEVLGSGVWRVPATTQSFSEAIGTVLTEPLCAEFWRKTATLTAAQWPQWKDVVPEYERSLLTC